ncbi:hypothetical protein FRC06_002902 [Ceratobasidium sp. 370]|nr:hypothetical protein FRC06_002902 [Ceratobasidium sp. 370]
MTELYPPLPPSPPASPGIPFPASKYEPPPYIRTSFSSGYIRSNSTSAVILAPTPIATSPSTPSLRRHSQSRGHRHTKSLNAHYTPPPLPLPKGELDPGYNSNKEDSDERVEVVIRQWRLKHNKSMSLRLSTDEDLTVPSLPDNPKLWTPAQLAQYLLTALRFNSSKSSEVILVPKPVAQDIANFVVECKLNGRAFLRLAEKDMEELGVNQLWRTALLSSSLDLRKSLLKGRIWGLGLEEGINTGSTRGHGRRVPSTVLEREESSSWISTPTSPVRILSPRPEDSSDQSEGHLSRNSSVLSFESDRSLKNAASPHPGRSRAQSTSSITSSSAGRVQEIVRNLERRRTAPDIEVGQLNQDLDFVGGKMTSAGEADTAGDNTIIVCEPEEFGHRNDEHTLFRTILDPAVVQPIDSPVTSQSSRTSESVFVETPPLPPLVDLPTIPQRDSIPPFHDPGEIKWTAPNEEPTMEVLPRDGGVQGERLRATSWGAKAWEVDFPGGTSRRVLASAPITRTSAESLTDNTTIQGETIAVPRGVWDDLCRRLDEAERRLASLEKQEAKRKQGTASSSQNGIDDHDEPKSSSSGGLSPVTLPPYLVIVGVGVCALVAQFVLGHMVGRRSRI